MFGADETVSMVRSLIVKTMIFVSSKKRNFCFLFVDLKLLSLEIR